MPWRSGGVVRSPVGQRIHVEVLAVEVDALLAMSAVDVVGEPLPAPRRCPGSAARACAAEQPFRMVLRKPGARRSTRSGSNQTIDLHALRRGRGR